MDQDLNQKAQELKENCLKTQVAFDKNDTQTLKKRQQIKEKLINNIGITGDVDALLTSIEHYCFIILQSLK